MQIVVNGISGIPVDSKPLVSLGNYYANALACLGCDTENPPLADLLRLHYQLDGMWVIASPIHWEATHNDAMIVATDTQLDLSHEESCLWFSEIARFLQANDSEMVYHDPYTWLLRIDNKPIISSKSVYRLLHQSLMPVLSNLDKQLFWQRLITELQMFLSSHPLNANRKSELSINGVWFWGEGKFDPTIKQKIITDDEVFLGLPNNNITQLSPSLIAEKNTLLFIKYPEQIDLANLQEKMQQNTVQWYWNNLAYLKQPSSWWSRLWRS